MSAKSFELNIIVVFKITEGAVIGKNKLVRQVESGTESSLLCTPRKISKLHMFHLHYYPYLY